MIKTLNFNNAIRAIVRRRKKLAGYQVVKSEVFNWVSEGVDAEEYGLKKVNQGLWHRLDLYHALIISNANYPKLVVNYGEKYIKLGGDEVDVIFLINNQGAKFSVKGVLAYIDKNGVNNTLKVYSLKSLGEHENGHAIAKALYTGLVKSDVALSLPYGLWAALYSEDEAFITHVFKRLTWLSESKKITFIFDEVSNIVEDKTAFNLFLEPLILNADKSFSEKFVRLNLDKIDKQKIANIFVQRGVDVELYAVAKKVAASVWSDKNYELSSLLYSRLVEVLQESIMAERYILSSVYAGSNVNLTHDIVTFAYEGYRELVENPNKFSSSEWFDTYPNVARKAIDDIVKTGELQLAVGICEKFNFQHPKFEHWRDLISIAENGLVIPEHKKSFKAYNKKITYLLYNSLPVHSGGYATRSHGIISNLMCKGISPYVMTRLGYPYDLNKFKNRELVDQEIYDGITYYRLVEGDGLNFIPVSEYLNNYKNAVKDRLQKNDSSLIHAASNHINGIAAVLAGRELGVRTVFEVRGMWEVTRLSRQPEWEGTIEFKAYRYLETLACDKADLVITITESLKHELIQRGIESEKIHVIPNGVDTDIFKPVLVNRELKSDLGIALNDVVIGYVGSIVDYEGLDLLVDSIQYLVESGMSGFKVLIVGDGVELQSLKEKVSVANLNNYFVFTGRVPHEEVPSYYSVIDICPFPRRGLPVCELVSPLKPFEAMAMGKVVIGSSVKAIAEFIDEGVNGFVHQKDSVEDLAAKLMLAIKDEGFREKIKTSSRAWAVDNRDWKVLSEKVYGIYESSL